jgi:hypothetical protein
MLSEIVLSSISNAIFAQLIDHAVQDDHLRRWLGLRPARLAFEKAWARAYTTFARQYPDIVALLVDSSFLENEAVVEIAKLLTHEQSPDPVELAKRWARSMGREEAVDAALVRGASDFCDWLNAELHSEPILQPLFNYQSLANLPAMEARLENLVQEISELRRQAVDTLNSYAEVIAQRVSIQGSHNIVGSHNSLTVYNQYFMGDTPETLYKRPDAVFERVKLDQFVGREWLEGKVEDFLLSKKSGVFLLVGDAGTGKTTFMAHLVEKYRYLHVFAEQLPGDANVSRAIQSLVAQLVMRYQVGGYPDLSTLPQIAGSADYLDTLIREAARKLNAGERLVMVCDGLDEAGATPMGNVFGLPKNLPDGVYLILSQRPVSVPLRFELSPHTVHLDMLTDENLGDIQKYLAAAARCPAIALQLKSSGYSQGEFIRQLTQRSGGVWIYLYYVVQEIEAGGMHPLKLEKLPDGVSAYYARNWSDWREGRRGEGRARWRSFYSALLGLMAAVQQPASAKQLALWSGLAEDDIAEHLSEYWRAFISRQTDAETEPQYRIYHASLRDFILDKQQEQAVLPPGEEYLRNDLKKATKAAHQKIVAFYRKQCGGNWICLAGQEYPRRYLAYHLAEAGEYATLYALTIESDVWAKEKFRLEGHYDSYLSDLAVVFDALKKDRDVGRLMRAAFCQASILSSSGNISTELLNACVAEKVIPLEVALVYIGQRTDSLRIFEGYFAIWQALPEVQRKAHQHRLLTLALQHAIKIYSGSERSHALTELSPHLPAELMTEALSAARSIADEDARSIALTGLAPHLPAELKTEVLTEALSAARSIADEYTRSRALTGLAPHLPAELMAGVLTDALSAARSITDEYYRSLALIGLAHHLPTELMAEALSTARSIAIEYARSIALAGFIPHLPDELKEKVLTEALSAARSIADEHNRSLALVNLAPHLTSELMTDALSAACSIANEYDRSDALVELTPYLPAELRAEVLTEALTITSCIQWESARSSALVNLAPHLTSELMAEALSTACRIKNEKDRSSALAGLAPHLPAELMAEVLTEALSTARSIADEDALSLALAWLAPHLPSELVAETLSTIRSIANEHNRSRELTELAPHLPAELMADALSIARSIAIEFDRSISLLGLAPHLPVELRIGVLTEALFTARSIADEGDRSRALTELAPHLPAELMADALSTARNITNEDIRSNALTELVTHLPAELRAEVLIEALSAARSIAKEEARSRALNGLVLYLPAELMAEALSTARSIAEESNRSSALVELVSRLPTELRSEVLTEALSAARNVANEDARSEALTGLAPHLPVELRAEVVTEALSYARSIESKGSRSYVLHRLAPYLDIDQLSVLLGHEILEMGEFFGLAEIIQHWQKIAKVRSMDEYQMIVLLVQKISSISRQQLLWAVEDLAPLLLRLGGQNGVNETARAILDAGRWWP